MPKYVVRYGVMRHLGVFSSRPRELYARGQRVIARTGRGQESGEILCEATEHVLSQMEGDTRSGQILRLESHDDAVELRKLHSQENREFATVEARIKELGLEMKLVKVERLYGGERVVVFYISEERVDFRELVKALAKDLQTRVEMRQIGVRDEAKLLADYGDCGKPVCCNTHLSEMPPVSMKMAKMQKATLDPTKISGRCGRLKCCLRYEYDTYEALQKELPRVGYEVLTRDGRARVLAVELLTQELVVETEGSRRVVIPASDVLSVVGKSAREERPRSGDGGRDSGGGGAAPSGDGDAPTADARPVGRERGGRQPRRRGPRGADSAATQPTVAPPAAAPESAASESASPADAASPAELAPPPRGGAERSPGEAPPPAGDA